MPTISTQTDNTDEVMEQIHLLTFGAKRGKEIDPSKTVLRLVIQKFSEIESKVFGPIKVIDGVQWRIMVMPKKAGKYLGFYLQCKPKTFGNEWECEAEAEMRIISHCHGVADKTRQIKHTFDATEDDWGYTSFIPMEDLLNKTKSLIKNDTVMFEVSFSAQKAKNIYDYEAFKTRIEAMIAEAESICKAGDIDDATEVINKAIEFCGKHDMELKEKLNKMLAEYEKLHTATIKNEDTEKNQWDL